MNPVETIRRAEVAPGELAVCWLGQAGFLLRDGQGTELVIDPYLSNCGERIRGFKRLSPMLLRPGDMSPDYYITTHLHFDHFDYDAIPEIVKNSRHTLFLGPSSCCGKLSELGAERCSRLDRGDVYEDGRVSIRGVLADHGDMAPDAIGVLLEMGGCRLYFSGDTAFHEELFLEIAGFRPDVAALSVNGRFGNLNSAEGARAAALCGARYAIPCHFWTFAEHGGDPGEFCRLLLQEEGCKPLCFRQGEVQVLREYHHLSNKNTERNPRDESDSFYAAGGHRVFGHPGPRAEGQ